MSIPTRMFYLIKPLIPRGLQLALRRQLILRKRKRCADVWPILESAGRSPEGWKGWPNGNKFAFVLTHDVDTDKGHDNCLRLADLDEKAGFRSSFNFVPERYKVSSDLRYGLLRRGFEVGIHGLVHDGKLFASRKIFEERAERINRYLEEWGCSGFRSPAMHHNLEWICELNVQYDASTFDTDPFEPQPDGMGTIFPLWIARDGTAEGYVELPYTLVQDFTLLVLMREKGIDIWKRKLDWIAQKGGMALLNAHPDYMNFGGTKVGREEYPAEYYAQLLDYVKQKYGAQYWQVLPKEMAQFWSANYRHIQLVKAKVRETSFGDFTPISLSKEPLPELAILASPIRMKMLDKNSEQLRSLDRRSGEDRRKLYTERYFLEGGIERRSGNERRHQNERRKEWIRISKWSSIRKEPLSATFQLDDEGAGV